MSTLNLPFSIYIINHSKLSQICSYGILFQGTQAWVRNSHVKEPSVLEPLKFYCICFYGNFLKIILKFSLLALLIWSTVYLLWYLQSYGIAFLFDLLLKQKGAAIQVKYNFCNTVKSVEDKLCTSFNPNEVMLCLFLRTFYPDFVDNVQLWINMILILCKS